MTVFLRRLVTVPAAIVLIVATVAVARLIAVAAPIGSDHSRPWIHSGRMGEPVFEDDFEVTVLAVRGGRAVDSSLGTRMTDGVFLLVRVRLEALDTPSRLGYAEVVDARGNAYETDDFVSNTVAGQRLDPGIAIEGELLFEVPPTSASDLILRLTSSPGYWGEYNVVVEVPLEISEEDVSDWHADGSTLALMEPEVVA